MSSPLQFVVCGTDTDVGKTLVSALLVQGLGAHYWKPVQSGLNEFIHSEWFNKDLVLSNDCG